MNEFNFNRCDHVCHKRGLNPWVEICVVCGCPNAKYNPNIPAPETMGELIGWNAPDRSDRAEKYRTPEVDALVDKEDECSSETR